MAFVLCSAMLCSAVLSAAMLLATPRRLPAQGSPVSAAAGAAGRGSGDAERRIIGKSWVPMWRAGGTPDDTLFGWVREHVADSSQVYVLDAGTLQLHAFSTRDGTHRWSVGGKGSGPGQLKRPVDVALATGGHVAVLDPGNGRVSFFAANGAFVRSTATPEAAVASALCVLSDQSMLMVVTAPSAFAVRTDRSGRVIRRHAFPWRLDQEANELVTNATFVRGAPASSCVAATSFGFGLAFFDVNGSVRTAPFVERVAPPTFRKTKLKDGDYAIMLDKGDNAALGGWRDGDTTFVSFAGSKVKGGVIDLYDQRGRYLASWPTPQEDRIYYANRRLYGLSSGGATQKLRMWVDASDSTRVLREGGFRPAGRRAVSRAGRPADRRARR